jgi:hypothetical protein
MPTPEPNLSVFITENAYVLDQSGSMGLMQESAVAAFNEFIKSQRDLTGDALLTLVLLGDRNPGDHPQQTL